MTTLRSFPLVRAWSNWSGPCDQQRHTGFHGSGRLNSNSMASSADFSPNTKLKLTWFSLDPPCIATTYDLCQLIVYRLRTRFEHGDRSPPYICIYPYIPYSEVSWPGLWRNAWVLERTLTNKYILSFVCVSIPYLCLCPRDHGQATSSTFTNQQPWREKYEKHLIPWLNKIDTFCHRDSKSQDAKYETGSTLSSNNPEQNHQMKWCCWFRAQNVTFCLLNLSWPSLPCAKLPKSSQKSFYSSKRIQEVYQPTKQMSVIMSMLPCYIPLILAHSVQHLMAIESWYFTEWIHRNPVGWS